MKREAGRKTAIFLIMVSKPNSPPLAVTYLSMLGRLKVKTEVMIEKICCGVGSEDIATISCTKSCGPASKIASALLMYVDWLCINMFLASNTANSLIKMKIAGEKINRGIKRIKWNTEGREKPKTKKLKTPGTSPRRIIVHPTMAAAGEGRE